MNDNVITYHRHSRRAVNKINQLQNALLGAQLLEIVKIQFLWCHFLNLLLRVHILEVLFQMP